MFLLFISENPVDYSFLFAMEDVFGFVLAGGKSSRMGIDKAFLEIHGKTFLEHAVVKLERFCGRVFVVLNENQKEVALSLGVERIFDIFKGRGALGGIHASFRNCSSRFAFILAVDLPLVKDKTIGDLIKIIRDNPKVDAVVPIEFKRNFCEEKLKQGRRSVEFGQWKGEFGQQSNTFRLQPLCAVYRVENCLPIVEKVLLEKKSASVRDFLGLISVRFEKLVEEELFNVNTQEDYRKVL